MTSRSTRARSRALLALLALALAGVAGCDRGSPEEFETRDKVSVVLREARTGSIRPAVECTGVVKPAPGAEMIVVAPQPGRILELPKGEGDPVRQGELLVRFEIPSLESDAASRRSDLSRAEARLENARSASERIEKLFDRGVAARKEVEDSGRELAEAEAVLAEARSARSAAAVLQQREIVRARFDGIVAGRWHNPGDLVEAASGDPVLRVVDPARLQVEASLPLGALTRVAIGDAARVFGPAGGEPEQAAVRTMPASVDPSTSAATIRLSFSGRSRLPAGTPVRVEILGEERRDVVLVPAAALVTEGTETFVFVVDEREKARRRKVSVGARMGGDAEIISGVSPGEKVVVQGQDALPDGAEVSPAS